ncbi:hypothetical protein T492DRAFT_960673 [Pavlovales sp. CCMP2436]|nr:hypothetical protein T492DRAFT_960673 [Pavlovales sp. CCMP2436]|mmetsp:Transcript_5633/g.14705  ORF Transcript_5633/g.14705 Transcript_5633/m.14705 type:complete len:334 (+) Transcript_5633:163-1164(+)
MAKLSSEELGEVYGGESTPEPAPGTIVVDIGDDLSATDELNPQSLSFEEISVGGGGGDTPSRGTTRMDAPGSARAHEASAAPYLGGDSAGKSAQHSTQPIRASGTASGGLVAQGASSLDADAANASLWQLAYYKPLFDVDSHHILTRIIHALLPRPRAQFFEVVASSPDFYGPFWISTTLVFVIGVSGNLAKWLSFKPSEVQPQWTYDFTKLSGASTAIYIYAVAGPLACWVGLRYIQANKQLVDVVCLYGYSLAPFVPVSLLCVVPSSLLRWLLFLVGCAISAAFLLSNVYTHLQDCFPYSDSDSMRRGYMLLAAMGTWHALFTLIVKLCFF